MRKTLLALVIGALLFHPAAAQAEGSQTYGPGDGTRFQQLYGFGTAALTPSGEFTLAAAGLEGVNSRIAGGWQFAVPASAPDTALVQVVFSAANLSNGAVAAYQVSTGTGACGAAQPIALGSSDTTGAASCSLGSGANRVVKVTFSGQAGGAPQAVSLSGQLQSVTLSW